jgi:hypothetical protein
MYTRSSHYRDAGRAKEKTGTEGNAACQWFGCPVLKQLKNVAAAVNTRQSSGFGLLPMKNE